MNMEFVHKDLDTQLDRLSSMQRGGLRLYETPSGKLLPSVTTVVGFEKQAFFAEWRRKNPKEARRVTARGTRLHTIIEHYLDNDFDAEDPKSKSEILPTDLELFLLMRPHLDNINNIVAQEVPLWSETVGLAGRVDCIAEYNGKLSVIDFKGSTREKREEDIDNYFEQATAYAIMFAERTGINIDNIVIIIASEDGTTQVFEKNPIDYVKSLRDKIVSFKEVYKYEFEHDRELPKGEVV